jgi:hypothetical protein
MVQWDAAPGTSKDKRSAHITRLKPEFEKNMVSEQSF